MNDREEELVPDLDRATVIREVSQVVEHVERLLGEKRAKE